MILAIGIENIEVVESLIQNGAVIDFSVNGGWTPITIAISKNNMKIIQILITNGANINQQGLGQTPLSMAVEHGNKDMVKLLVENGATINIHGANGGTPFHVAILMKHVEIIKYFIDMGADLQFRTKNFKLTSIELALKSEEIPVLKTLCYNQ